MLSIIGLMSGTSADGIDASWVQSDGKAIHPSLYQLTYPYPKAVQSEIYKARENPAGYLADPHQRAALITAITHSHAQAVSELLSQAGHPEIDLIGFHGQTVYHNPEQARSIQLGDGTALAKMTHCPVVYDFRAADLAAGGHGAPLAPIYHQLVLQQADVALPALFINIGGVSNATFYDGQNLHGYDIGPGNALIDDLCQIFYQRPLDTGGEIAASGRLFQPFIDKVLADPFFALSGPRSLDRNHFHHYLSDPALTSLTPADQIATVTGLTAQSCLHMIFRLPALPKTLILAGGGAHNHELKRQICAGLPNRCEYISPEEIGCHTDFAEADLIALLAARYHYQLPSSFPETTGTSAPQICGIAAQP